MNRFVPAAALAAFAFAPSSFAVSTYKLPPPEVVRIFDAPSVPQTRLAPTGDAALLVDVVQNPPLSVVAEPFLRLAGVRLVPARGARQHLVYASGFSVLSLPEGRATRVTLPAGARLGMPVFSPDGKTFAFTRDMEDRVELWLGETKTGRAAAVPGVRLNDVAADAVVFSADSRTLWLVTVPPERGPAPPEPAVPQGPVVEETTGRTAQPPTFEDLLHGERDEDLFDHFATSQVARLDVASKRAAPVGAPGLYTRVDPSPDGRYLLVARMKRPFSYRVPYGAFPHALEIWDGAGRLVRAIADLPLADETPRQGVPTGPRHVDWQPMEEASLLWVEALDGGDPLRKVPFRESLEDARRSVRGRGPGGAAARPPVPRARLDRHAGNGDRDGVRPGPPLADDVGDRHRQRDDAGARPVRPVGAGRVQGPRPLRPRDVAARPADDPPGGRRRVPLGRGRDAERSAAVPRRRGPLDGPDAPPVPLARGRARALRRIRRGEPDEDRREP